VGRIIAVTTERLRGTESDFLGKDGNN
jgi:hypothetical protein